MRNYANRPPNTVPRARQLRRDASTPELRLLRGLREAFPDLKWRHQVPIGPFYADILCFSERLVIEVDGDTHAGMAAADARRTVYIERQGYRVIRFTNDDVLHNLEGVLTHISLSLRDREEAPQARKGEDSPNSEKDRAASATLPSPFHAAARRGPLPLPMGEEI